MSLRIWQEKYENSRSENHILGGVLCLRARVIVETIRMVQTVLAGILDGFGSINREYGGCKVEMLLLLVKNCDIDDPLWGTL